MYLLRGLITSLVALAVLTPRPASAVETLCDASHEDCRTPLLKLINAETQGIDVAFWFMEDARYSAALIDKWKAGVRVRVIMDTEANVNYPDNKTILASLKTAGIPMIEKTSGGIVHWKTMIFVGQNKVEFSGANFSPHAFVPVTPYQDYIDEVIYFTDDPAIVNSFKTRYDDVWVATSGYTNYNNAPAPRARRYPVFPIDSQLNFPPFNNFASRSVSQYNAEKVVAGGQPGVDYGIDAIMFRITDPRHTDALIAAIGRGVPVRLITEPGQYRDPVRMWHSWNVDRLYMAGAQIRVRAHAGGENAMHQKTTLLRSQKMTIFGSSNWTSPSATSQLEHNIFTKKTFFYDYMSNVFQRKWINAQGSVETKPFVPLPPDAPLYVSPANAAPGQNTSVTLKWNAGYFAHVYDIYLDTSPTLSTATVFRDQALGPSNGPTDYVTFTVSGLQPATTYYWKVVSKTVAKMAKAGPIWSFCTEGAAPTAGEGDVVLYASRTSKIAGSKWTLTSDTSAAGGVRIGTANAGLKGSLTTPTDYFELTFNAAAGTPYHLWIRGKAVSNSWGNDSVYVQFSDSVTSSGASAYRINSTARATVTIEDCTSCGLSAWGWNDNATGSVAGQLGPDIYFASSGAHTIRVLMREDGLSIDQIVLSKGPYLASAPGATKDDGTILAEAGGTSTGAPAPAQAPSLPADWASRDIGAVGVAGSATGDGTAFTVRGAGADVWNTADAFHYAYRTLSGDATITARVASISGTQAWTKVGVMIRGGTSAGSAHAFMLVSLGRGLAFQRRTSDGALSTSTAGPTGTAPRWVRLQRSGALIVASASTDGTTWTTVDTDTFALPSTVLVGLAVSSHSTSSLATGAFDDLTISTP